MARRIEKRKKRSILFAPVSFLLVCMALIFGLSVFFRVYNIEVTGNSYYTSEEIVEASGIEQGDNLFFINRSSVVARIYARLPYVERADIRRSLPNRLVIEVTESGAIAYVTAEDGDWAIDRSCKLLSRVDETERAALIRVDGLTPIAPEEGQTIAAGEAERAKVTYLSEILYQISTLGMQDDVTWIDISSVSNPSFDYLGRFTVKLGASEDVDYKFQCLLSASEKLADGDRGTLDLSIDKQVHLIYD
ncbi:MAG: FtsQ-type POTRA domain-containing protein [Oscillospiraceae bacterium]|nr:FtsQ-type POTRA domain-containing protein [Oscillospiraceae bacterium]